MTKIDDTRFLKTVNDIVRERKVDLPPLDRAPDGDSVALWADFLQSCVRSGLKLSDPRWQRLTLDTGRRPARFVLQPAGDGQEDEEDFSVGLALLMGMLGADESGS